MAATGRTVCQNGWGGFSDGLLNPSTRFDAGRARRAALSPDRQSHRRAERRSSTGSSNVFGVDQQSGFARSAYDNVGVQYGLNALNAGLITKAEFLDLNEKIGGLDLDGNPVPQRTEGDLKAVEIAYETGSVVTSGENFAPAHHRHAELHR